MEKTNFKNEIWHMFLTSEATSDTELSIITGLDKYIYLLDQAKVKQHYKRLLEIALLIKGLDRGILIDEMCKLKDGNNWTQFRQHMIFLTSLLDGAGLIEYVNPDEKGPTKIKLIEHKVNTPKIGKIN